MTRDLRALFEPRSVAILGASNTPGKWGFWLARGALRGRHRRAVYLVNRSGGAIHGHASHRSLSELPEAPELVVVSVPSAAFEEAVDSSLDAGARAIVGISAGLGEASEEGRAVERAVVERVREAGAVLLGPNCLGVYDAGAELELVSDDFPAGPLGFISQSGMLAIELGLGLADAGLGYSRFASLGNQADLEAAELVTALTMHDETRVIAVYCEDFRDGRAFAQAAHAAVAAGKPVLVITVGGSEASASAARSHTGALVSSLAAVDAACRASGAIRVASPKELVDAVQALVGRRTRGGRRIAVAADGGGHGALAADLAARHGLELPHLSRETAALLSATLPATATTRNPVDLAGGGERDVFSFARVVEILLRSAEVDAVLLAGYFGGYSQYSDEFEERECAAARAMIETVAAGEAPLVVHTLHPSARPAEILRAGGVPVFRDIDAAVAALARMAELAERPPWGVPRLPAPAAEPIGKADYWTARSLLADAGIPFARACRVTSWDEVRAAASGLGYPVVLKALGSLHKSDAGGVVVGIANEAALEVAFTDLLDRLGPEELSLEAKAPLSHGIELIVGSRRDRRFGPVALVGLGGLYAELLQDVAVALAPLTAADGEALLGTLRAAPLLQGARGRLPVDLAAAGRVVAALSGVAAGHPEIAELEINPLLVTPSGALALDARVVLAENGEADAR